MLNHILMTVNSVALGALALLVAVQFAHGYDGALTLLKARL